MTDKELLEEIKEYFGLWMKNDISRDWSLSSETIDNLKYMIEQAERVQELVKAHELKDLEHQGIVRQIKEKDEQNMRYREAIARIKQTSKECRGGHLLDIQDNFFVDEIISIINKLEDEE